MQMVNNGSSRFSIKVHCKLRFWSAPILLADVSKKLKVELIRRCWNYVLTAGVEFPNEEAGRKGTIKKVLELRIDCRC